jgi:hypothetical protein
MSHPDAHSDPDANAHLDSHPDLDSGPNHHTVGVAHQHGRPAVHLGGDG